MKSYSKWYFPSCFSSSKDSRFGFLLWLSCVTASLRGLVAVLEESRSSNDMEQSARCDDIDRLKQERWRSLGLFRTLPSLYSSPFSGDKYSANVCQSVTAERLPAQLLTLPQSDCLAASARALMLSQIFETLAAVYWYNRGLVNHSLTLYPVSCLEQKWIVYSVSGERSSSS